MRASRAKKQAAKPPSNAKATTFQPHYDEIERRQEIGAVTRLKRLRTSRDLPSGSEIFHQIARRQHLANGAFRQYAPSRRYDFRPSLDAAMRQRYIGRDYDAPPCDTFGDPIVGGVGAVANDNPLYERFARDSHITIADNINLERIPFGDAVDFRLHRTGVGIDIDDYWLGRFVQTLLPVQVGGDAPGEPYTSTGVSAASAVSIFASAGSSATVDRRVSFDVAVNAIL